MTSSIHGEPITNFAPVRYRVDIGRTRFVLPGFSPLPKKGPLQ
jgi:hypothetical protein